MKFLAANKRQLVIALILLVVVYLMMDLNNRLSEYFRLSEQRNQMRTVVIEDKRTEQALQTQVAYATSDAAVADWAYEYGHKSQPGDTVILPMQDENYKAPTPTPASAPTEKVENWQVWRVLFFGQ